MLKHLFSIILFCLFVSALNAQLISKKEFRLKDQEQSLNFSTQKIMPVKPFAIRDTNKSLLFAGVLSFIIPGAAFGQFYKEEFINGGIRFGISVLCIIWFSASPTFDVGGGGDATQKLIATGIYVVNWIASIVDALIPTKHNRYSKYRKYKLNF